MLLEKGVRLEACFPAEGAPLLAVGRTVDLEVARVGSPEAARALGKVIHRRDATGLRPTSSSSGSAREKPWWTSWILGGALASPWRMTNPWRRP